MKRFLWFSAFLLLISGAAAQTGANPKATNPKSTAKRSAAPARVSAKEVQELREALAVQAVRQAAPTAGSAKISAAAIA